MNAGSVVSGGAAAVAMLRPSATLAETGRQWAERLGLAVVGPEAAGNYQALLLLQTDAGPPGYRLLLQATGAHAPGPVAVDFVGGALGHRRRFGGGRGQTIARAIGLRGGATPTVADLTAGLGRDAFVLASLGCRVQLVERLPLIAALLENGLARAAQDPDAGPSVARMRLVCADGKQWLQALEPDQAPEVIYLDPMYPQRSKQALVKKEMQLFHRLVGGDPDAAALLTLARQCARKRVVVKRPRGAPALDGPAPGFTLASRNTRYDVYPVG